MENRPKIVFMGTPDFARQSLKRIVESGFDVAAVITQPDKPQGRGNRIIPPPVKTFALENSIPVLQPEKTSGVIGALKEMNPDFIAVVAYGQILKQDILCVPCRICKELNQRGCVNLHASLLPAYRGASPIQWAIINGEKETGVTTMLMEEGMDTGPILLQEKIAIGTEDTFASLHDNLAAAGADLLVRTLESFDSITPRNQDHSRATYTQKMTKNHGLIDWSRAAVELHNLVRGCNPWPAAHTFMNGARIIIWETTPLPDESGSAEPGTVTGIGQGQGIRVATGNGTLVIKEIQRQGKKRQSFDKFLLGFSISPGSKFSSSIK